MGLGAHALRLPRKEDAHFLSLIGGGAVLMTVFFLFISTASEQAQYEDHGVATQPPEWRRSSLEVRSFRRSWSYAGQLLPFIRQQSLLFWCSHFDLLLLRVRLALVHYTTA